MPSRSSERAPQRKGRPRFWLSLLLLMLILVLIGAGQWDLVVAVFIGLVVGNAASFLLGKD